MLPHLDIFCGFKTRDLYSSIYRSTVLYTHVYGFNTRDLWSPTRSSGGPTLAKVSVSADHISVMSESRRCVQPQPWRVSLETSGPLRTRCYRSDDSKGGRYVRRLSRCGFCFRQFLRHWHGSCAGQFVGEPGWRSAGPLTAAAA